MLELRGLLSHALAYLLGGITLVPFLCLALVAHAYYTLPRYDSAQAQAVAAAADRNGPDGGLLQLSQREREVADEELKALPEEIHLNVRPHVPDVAAGYFVVCRDYDGTIMNGKSPIAEKTGSAASSTTSLVAAGDGGVGDDRTKQSPSVYQTMYRSIFERGKTQGPSINSNGGAKTGYGARKTRNVFFIVIRLGLLMLYDDVEQLEVRHVIALAHYDVDIYGGGGEEIPEGELFVKRNCIRMMPKPDDDTTQAGDGSRPFYLFTTNCSEKEDFYYAMLLQAQQNKRTQSPSPGAGADESQTSHQVLGFADADMVKLIRTLHASQDTFQTRWLNALIGRLFLSMSKTKTLERFVRRKINKKLARVAKPAFISAIQIRNIHLGDAAPFVTAPRLREMTRDGDLTLEAQVGYEGAARIDVAAVARIDLGSRFKVREVELILAIICKSVKGKMFFRIKPPPSNRVWFTFEKMPKMELVIEPVVSTRQITYGLVLRAIETRLKEVIAETVVMPNWDDVPFADTAGHAVRAGLWLNDGSDAVDDEIKAEPTPKEGGQETKMEEDEDPVESEEKAVALAEDEDGVGGADGTIKESEAVIRRKNKRGKGDAFRDNQDDALLQSTAWSSSADPLSQTPLPPARKPGRSRSFATPASPSAAMPILSHDQAVVEGALRDGHRRQHDAAAGLKDISSRSQPSTPTDSPVGSPSADHRESSAMSRSKSRRASATSKPFAPVPETVGGKKGNNGAEAHDADDGASVKSETSQTKRRQMLATTTAAASAAKKWGIGFVARHAPQPSQKPGDAGNGESQGLDSKLDEGSSAPSKFFGIKAPAKEQTAPGTKLNPMGRGIPLPPPGQPLPGPKRGSSRMSWAGPLTMLGRRATTERPSGQTASSGSASSSSASASASTLPIDVPKGSGVETRQSAAFNALSRISGGGGGTPTSPGVDESSRGNNHVPPPKRVRKQSSDGGDRKSVHGLLEGRDEDVLVISAPEHDDDDDDDDDENEDEEDEAVGEVERPGVLEVFAMSESPAKDAPSGARLSKLTTELLPPSSSSYSPTADVFTPLPPPTPQQRPSQSRIAVSTLTSRSSTPSTLSRRTTDPASLARSPSIPGAAAASPDLLPSPTSSTASSSAGLNVDAAAFGSNSGGGVGAEVRKARSRQSLIPVPAPGGGGSAGSRRASPVSPGSPAAKSRGEWVGG